TRTCAARSRCGEARVDDGAPGAPSARPPPAAASPDVHSRLADRAGGPSGSPRVAPPQGITRLSCTFLQSFPHQPALLAGLLPAAPALAAIALAACADIPTGPVVPASTPSFSHNGNSPAVQVFRVK